MVLLNYRLGRPQHHFALLASRWMLGLVLMFICGYTYGLDPEKHLSQYVHRVWQDREGLPQNSVQAICQGPQGYIWVATQEGLVRFDGVHFRVFDKLTHPEMKNHDIQALIVGVDGELWFGNRAGGVFRFDEEGIQAIDIPNPGSPVIALVATSSDLWIGTLGGGLFHWDRNTQKGSHVSHVQSKVISSLLLDRAGYLWLGTRDHVLLRMNPDGAIERFIHAAHSAFEVSRIFEDRQGVIWVGTETNGLFSLSGGELRSVELGLTQAERSISALLEDDDGSLWIATTGAGLLRLVNGQLSRFPAGQSLSHEIVGSLFEDHEGNIWVGTLGGGLNQYSDCSFVPFTADLGLTNEVGWTFFPDQDDQGWVGTDGGGIFFFDGKSFIEYENDLKLTAQTVVLGVVRDQQQTLWVATDRQGLFGIRPDELLEFGQTELDARFLGVIHRDSDQRIWVGTADGGVFYISANALVRAADLGEASILAMVDAPQGGIYVGSSGGVHHVDVSGSADLVEGTADLQINSMATDSRGILWLGTFSRGLYGIGDGTLSHLTVADGLHDNSLFQILIDGRDGFWFTSNRGVYHITRDQIESHLLGLKERVEVQHFTVVDGMKSMECNFLGGNSGYVTDKGLIWVPTMKGMVRIDPSVRHVNRFPPKTLIEEIIFGEDRVVLEPGQGISSDSRNFEFHFTCLSFRAPNDIRFRYRLLGYSDQWIEAGSERVAYFSSLPHGDFTFEVEAVNEDGVRSSAPERRTVKIVPPLYLQGWFLALSLVALVAALLFADRLRAKHHKRRSQEMESEVLEKTKELDAIREEIVHINQQLAENARIAGMAEMATEVLHNIGNALNTATTSATLLHQMLIDPTSVRVVTRIVKLINDHKEDLAEFISLHEQGAKLPDVLARLAPILENKEAEFLHEVQLLQKQINHINEIIENQQDVEWTGRALENTDLTLLVENAVQMFSGQFGSQGIDIVQDLKPVPLIRVYRSDFLQILTNLIKNAGEAMMDSSNEKASKLTVKTYSKNEICVVEVKDNGRGIAAADIPRIFEFGFSTKVDGHGFGLHYCARVIERVGGNLRVESAGVGQGACFTIEMPQTGSLEATSSQEETADVGA